MPEAEAKVPIGWPPHRVWVTNAYGIDVGGQRLALAATTTPPPPANTAVEYVTAASRDAAVRDALERAAQVVEHFSEGPDSDDIAEAIRALIPGGPA